MFFSLCGLFVPAVYSRSAASSDLLGENEHLKVLLVNI